MKFVHSDLGYRQRGDRVEVTLSGNSANVRLLDSSAFSSYKAGRQHRYHGGRATRSPVVLTIPHSGHWHVAVDMQGLGGSVRASFRMLPDALPPIQERPLSDLPSLLRRELAPVVGPASDEIYDVFISHASEDKDEIVRALALELRNRGLTVWYDEFELRIGDSLRRKIDRGLAASRFGVVVFSKAFFSKGWTNYELDGIVTRTMTGAQVLLPIWHGVTKQEVISFSPSLADRLARSTGTHTVAEIAEEIATLIQSTDTEES